MYIPVLWISVFSLHFCRNDHSRDLYQSVETFKSKLGGTHRWWVCVPPLNKQKTTIVSGVLSEYFGIIHSQACKSQIYINIIEDDGDDDTLYYLLVLIVSGRYDRLNNAPS